MFNFQENPSLTNSGRNPTNVKRSQKSSYTSVPEVS